MSIDFSDTGFETQEPLVTTSLTRDDENEGSLRPKTLREYIGQDTLFPYTTLFRDRKSVV